MERNVHCFDGTINVNESTLENSGPDATVGDIVQPHKSKGRTHQHTMLADIERRHPGPVHCRPHLQDPSAWGVDDEELSDAGLAGAVSLASFVLSHLHPSQLSVPVPYHRQVL